MIAVSKAYMDNLLGSQKKRGQRVYGDDEEDATIKLMGG